MSTEQGSGELSQKPATNRPNTSDSSTSQSPNTPQTPSVIPENRAHIATDDTITSDPDDRKKSASSKPDQISDQTTSPSTPDDPRSRPRQVIAVSASKGPAAFFNLARKFLVTDETCDLSALEGAIVSAADAAHLLERSKLATIVRIQTSYVTVEPKRRKQAPSPQQVITSQHGSSPLVASADETSSQPQPPLKGRPAPGRELRRARIVITVKRTGSYKQWLEDNPLQALIASDGDDQVEAVEAPQER